MSHFIVNDPIFLPGSTDPSRKVDGIKVSKCTQFVRNWSDESAPGAMVCGCWLSADAQSPVWLQLRTGYILSSGSLNTVPKRESDDYSQSAHARYREREKDGGKRGKEREVNTCTKARLCIGRKDVQRRSFFLHPTCYSFWCTNELFLVTFIFHFLFEHYGQYESSRNWINGEYEERIIVAACGRLIGGVFREMLHGYRGILMPDWTGHSVHKRRYKESCCC